MCIAEDIDYAALRREIKRDEGCRLRAYQDSVGVWTIGYGTNLQILEIDIETAERWLDEHLGKILRETQQLGVWHNLSPVRRRVLTNMVYNLGLQGVRKFRSFLTAIAKQDWTLAAVEMLDSKWYSQVKGRAERLAYMMCHDKEAPDSPQGMLEGLAPIISALTERRRAG